jgi:hypothetical protein
LKYGFVTWLENYLLISINVIPAQAGIQALQTFHHINLMTIILFYASYAGIYWISACAEMTLGYDK